MLGLSPDQAVRRPGRRPDRVRYQAVNRTVINVGFALGGLAAATALAIGTDTAFRTLVVGDALSYVIAALLVTRCAEPPSPSPVVAAGTGSPEQPVRRSSPWRDRGYLAYVGTEALLLLDDAILQVGLPLWIATRTSAPHSLAALLLVLNNVLVVLFVLPLSRLGRTPHAAASSLRLIAAAFLAGCAAMATSAAPAPRGWRRRCWPAPPSRSPSSRWSTRPFPGNCP